MKIVHFTAECYPVAKTGGLGDVLGALPKYLNNEKNIEAMVVMPYVNNDYVSNHKFDTDFEFVMPHSSNHLKVVILKSVDSEFPLYLVNIEGFNHRQAVYGYHDDPYFFVAFQTAALMWLHQWEDGPDIIHCHDFHTGFIPFMMKHAHQFHKFRDIPTVFTIHNGEYQGQLPWEVVSSFPWFDTEYLPLLEWNHTVNAMAAAIKCAWKVSTVSPQYMKELMASDHELAPLLRAEQEKCSGILNGIDNAEWDSQTDKHLNYHYSVKNLVSGKTKNKEEICKTFGFNKNYPLVTFIGRLVEQKGADVLANAIWRSINELDYKINFLIIGSGNEELSYGLNEMKHHTQGRFNCYIGYNESLARKAYAGSDFLVMPSRFEPCGLNQFYAFRYGTIPIARTVGGLFDSVIDINDEGGNGIRFIHLTSDDLIHSFYRAQELFNNKKHFLSIKRFIMKQDFSWEKSVKKYINLYKSIL